MSEYVEPQRISTGIEGLDHILLGGLPSGQMYLLEGEPGVGKTTLAMQFILAGVKAGEAALYITLSEPRGELAASARSHGWDLDLLPIAEFVPAEASLSPEEQYTVFHPSEVELASTIRKLTNLIDEVKPQRLVVDSLTELRLVASDSVRYRQQLLALKQFFAGRDTTVLLLDDGSGLEPDRQLQSIAHGVVRLEKVQRTYGATRRRLEVVKLRGSSYREGFHDYNILRGGLLVYPRLVANEHELRAGNENLASGVDRLDRMLGGGISRGSSTLLVGPTGSGKSSIAMQYAYASASRGERAIMYEFDEMLRTAQDRAEAQGLRVRREIERGTLAMFQIDPAEMSPGQLAWQIRCDLEKNNTRVVVIDSLNGYMNAMPGERDLTLHLHELLAYLNQKGIVTFITATQQGLIGAMGSEIDVSYLADTVILLRYFETGGELRRVISILKQRAGQHERALRQFESGPDGLQVGEPLTSFHGVLTGTPDMQTH